MEYYKMLKDNAIIGVATSKQFIRYTPVTNCLVRCTKQQGQYLTYKEQLYRDSWMQPTIINLSYTEVFIEQIEKEEYDILFEAFETIDSITIEEPDEEQVEPVIEPEDNPTLEFIRSSKLAAMSYACRTTIESGIDVILHGEIKHFSLTTQDQLNLMGLNISTGELIPYHADGEEMTFYTAEEINQIISAANQLKNYNTAYFNSLKTYINALDTIEDIAAITYGTIIPEEYKSDVLKVLE